MSAGEEAGQADFVGVRRERIRTLLNEIDLGPTIPVVEKVAKRSAIVDLWSAIVSETRDRADEKQLYNAHLARLELESITDAQRGASQDFVDVYKQERDAELRA